MGWVRYRLRLANSACGILADGARIHTRSYPLRCIVDAHPPMNSGLVGKRVLVTGASGDIGSEIVRRFVSQGADVGIHYYRNRHSAENLRREVQSQGAHAECFSADL